MVNWLYIISTIYLYGNWTNCRSVYDYVAISGFFSATVLVSVLLTIRKKKIKKEDMLENNI